MTDPFQTFLSTIHLIHGLHKDEVEEALKEENRNILQLASDNAAISLDEHGRGKTPDQYDTSSPTFKRMVDNPIVQKLLKSGLPPEVDRVEIDGFAPNPKKAGKFTIINSHYDEDGNKLVDQKPVTDGTDSLPPRSADPKALVHPLDLTQFHEFITSKLGAIRPDLAAHYHAIQMDGANRRAANDLVKLPPDQWPSKVQEFGNGGLDADKILHYAQGQVPRTNVDAQGRRIQTDLAGNTDIAGLSAGAVRANQEIAEQGAANKEATEEKYFDSELGRGLRAESARSYNTLRNDIAQSPQRLEMGLRNAAAARRQNSDMSRGESAEVAEAAANLKLIGSMEPSWRDLYEHSPDPKQRADAKDSLEYLGRLKAIVDAARVTPTEAASTTPIAFAAKGAEGDAESAAALYIRENQAAKDPHVDQKAVEIWTRASKDSKAEFIGQLVDEAEQHHNVNAARGLSAVRKVMGAMTLPSGRSAKEPEPARADSDAINRSLSNKDGADPKIGVSAGLHMSAIDAYAKEAFGEPLVHKTYGESLANAAIADAVELGDSEYKLSPILFLRRKLQGVHGLPAVGGPQAFLSDFYNPLKNLMESAKVPTDNKNMATYANMAASLRTKGDPLDDALNKVKAFAEADEQVRKNHVDKLRNLLGITGEPSVDQWATYLHELDPEEITLRETPGLFAALRRFQRASQQKFRASHPNSPTNPFTDTPYAR